LFVVICTGEASTIPDENVLKQYFSKVAVFKSKPAQEFAQLLLQSQFIISHAGAGSIFQSLNASKPLLVVINEKLADNHQYELADELHASKYVTVSRRIRCF